MPVFAIGFGSIGLPEMLVVLVIVLVLFGAGRLPQVFESFGKGIKSFRDAQKEDDSVDVTPKKLAESMTDVDEVKEKEAVRRS